MYFSRSAAAVFLLAVCASASAQCNSNDTTAPCFANVPDILGGRQSVLQDDDLVVNGVFVDPSISFFSPIADGRIGYTSNSQITGKGPTFAAPVTYAATNVVSVKGRMFNLKNDQVVSMLGAGAPGPLVQSASVAGLPGGVVPSLGLFGGPTQTLYGASGRFTGNGFDQMVFAAAQFNSPVRQIVLQAIGAVDPSHPASGISAGAATAPANNGSVVYAMTSGIFTDPQAGQAPPNAQVALLSGNPANGTGLTLSLYSVTANLTVVAGPTLNLNLGSDGSATLAEIAIASGRFAGGNHDQLVIAYAAPNAANPAMKPVKLVTIDFSAAGMPLQQTTFVTNATVHAATSVGSPAVLLRAARFNWFGNAAQVALSTFSYLGGPGNYSGTGQMQIVSFSPSLNATSGPAYSTSGDSYHYAIAAGRFDRMQANPKPPPATEINPNLQLADVSVYIAGEASQIILLTLYDVDPSTFAISLHLATEFFPYAYVPDTGGYGPLTFSLIAADMQGRSLAIGPPEKATVTGHIQPDLVLGLPPMHVDWVPPAGGGPSQVLNLSVYPKSFNTAYSFETSSMTNGSRSGTTSYSAATKQTIGAKISYGSPGLGGVSVQSSAAFGKMHEKVVATKFNTYSGQNNGFSTQTIFDDVVAASSSQMNIYSYRVIGQCAPKAGAPSSEGCGAGTLPLYVQFSGPDNLEYVKAVEGRNVEWYQPVQEPGNLFSYPANLQQLEADLAGGTSLVPLTPTNNIWDSQTSSKFFVNWTEGGGSNVSSGTTASHSFDAQVSVSASAGIFGFDVGASAGFGYNNSSSVSTLNQSTSSLKASSGVILNRGISGHSVTDVVYDYSGQSLIYGQQPPPGTIQDDIANTATVQAPGYIAAAHTTDMLSQGVVMSGSFWKQTYASAPDLALNHPQRWSQHQPSGIYEQQVWFNCPVGSASSGTSPSCTPNGQLPDPVSVADASFYYMKGLFVTPSSTTHGPQITSTTLGSKVKLRARVYNYSLANFPAGTVTHVQFYAQPWDSAHGQFTSLPAGGSTFAPAIFIGEGTDSAGSALGPIPAFCGGAGGGDPCLGSSVRNWVFASATWDTSKGNIAPNSAWKFWVVVWAEYNGQLVGEIAGHGLKTAPTGQFNSLADVPVETYSNNLGFYNQVFTVFAPAGASKKEKSLLTVWSVGLRAGSSTFRDLPVTLTASHRSSGKDIKSVLALYYDGNPETKGTLFDTQSIDRVPSGGLMDTARFTPQSCGLHQIFVRSIPQDGSAPAAAAQTTINVTINTAQAVRSVDDLIVYLQKLHAPIELRRELVQYLVDARRDFKEHRDQPALRNLNRFKDELREHRDAFEMVAAHAMQEQAADIVGCIPHFQRIKRPGAISSPDEETYLPDDN